MQVTFNDSHGKKFELCVEEGSHVFIKHLSGEEVFFAWEDETGDKREMILTAQRMLERTMCLVSAYLSPIKQQEWYSEGVPSIELEEIA